MSIYLAAEIDKDNNILPNQQYSVRGPRTASPDAANQGRFCDRLDMVTEWPKIGFVIQGNVIDNADGKKYSSEHFLEVESQLEASEHEPPVHPWPTNAGRP